MQYTQALRQSATKAARQLQVVSPAARSPYVAPSIYRLVPQTPSAQAEVLPDVFTPRPDATRLATDAATLTSEAVSQFTIFSLTKDTAALSRAISAQRDALIRAPIAVASQLSNMGAFLTARYNVTGKLENLESSIELKQRALDMTPTNDPERASRLGNLAASYGLRFRATRSEADLDRAIELQEQALVLTPPSHRSRLHRLEGLATALTGKAELQSIERCIVVAEEALRLAEDVVRQSKILGLLSFSFAARAKAQSAPADLDKAIELSEEALRLSPIEHADRPGRLASLAAVLRQKWALAHSDVPMLQRSYALDREAKKLRLALA